MKQVDCEIFSKILCQVHGFYEFHLAKIVPFSLLSWFSLDEILRKKSPFDVFSLLPPKSAKSFNSLMEFATEVKHFPKAFNFFTIFWIKF